MQMGFNNTVEHGDRKYHIQTEDLGLRAAKITAQVFRDGAILESISVPYGDKIAAAPNEDARDEAIRHTMRLVHKACFRNIQNGKYDAPVAAAPAQHVEDDDEPMVLGADDVEHVEEVEDVEMIDGFVVAGEQDDFEPAYLESHSRGAPVDFDADGFEEIRHIGDIRDEVSADFEEVEVYDHPEAAVAPSPPDHAPPSDDIPVAAEAPGDADDAVTTHEEPAPSASLEAHERPEDLDSSALSEPATAQAPDDDASDAAPSASAPTPRSAEPLAYHRTARAYRGLATPPEIALAELLNELLAS
jgi:hypothetical protein